MSGTPRVHVDGYTMLLGYHLRCRRVVEMDVREEHCSRSKPPFFQETFDGGVAAARPRVYNRGGAAVAHNDIRADYAR